MKPEYMTSMGEVIMTRENGSTRRKPVLGPIRLSLIQRGLMWERTWAFPVRGQRESWHGLT